MWACTNLKDENRNWWILVRKFNIGVLTISLCFPWEEKMLTFAEPFWNNHNGNTKSYCLEAWIYSLTIIIASCRRVVLRWCLFSYSSNVLVVTGYLCENFLCNQLFFWEVRTAFLVQVSPYPLFNDGTWLINRSDNVTDRRRVLLSVAASYKEVEGLLLELKVK